MKLENNTLTPLNKIQVITTSRRSYSSGGHEETNILHKILTVPSQPLIRLSHPEQIKKFTQNWGLIDKITVRDVSLCFTLLPDCCNYAAIKFRIYTYCGWLAN